MKLIVFLTALAASTSAEKTVTFTTPGPFYGTPMQIDQYVANKLHCARHPATDEGRILPGMVWSGANQIIPMSKKKPDEKMEANAWAKITPNDMCAIFNIPLDSKVTAGKYCTLIFAMSIVANLQVDSLYRYEDGNKGTFDFKGYDLNETAVAGVTSWNNQPKSSFTLKNPPPQMKLGYAYTISQGPCGVKADYGPWNLAVTMCSSDSTYYFTQNLDRCPLGFFVIITDKKPNGQ